MNQYKSPPKTSTPSNDSIILLIILSVCASGYAAEYRVPDHYSTITAAIDAVNNGDIIHIAPGTYSTATGESFPLQILNSITLTGDSQDTTHFKGDGEHTVVLIGTGGVSLQNLRITDGSGSEGMNNMDGGGICVFAGPDETNPVTIQNCTIENNICPGNETYDGCGGGIYCGGTYDTYFKVRISNCVIRQNSVYGQGGGVFCAPMSNVDMENTIIDENTASDSGGGIFVDIYSSINMNGTYMILNNCPGDPLTPNKGGKGGGLVCESCGILTAADCLFVQNTARYLGGSIYACGDSQSILRQCEFRNNHVYDPGQPCEGGGVYFTENATGRLIRCAFHGNTSQRNGGGIAITDNSKVTLLGTLFTGNSAFYNGGAMYFTSKGDGTIKNCTFTLNSSISEETGAGIYLEDDNIVNIDSSVIWQNSPDGIRSDSAPNVSYSCLQQVRSGTGNIVADPLLDLYTYEIQDNSPCIDSGNPAVSMNDACLPPGKGETKNDMGITGGPENCDSTCVKVFDFTSFGDPTSLVFRGNATLEDECLRLTQAQPSIAGGAWYPLPVYIQEGFETAFDFQIGQDGAEGFAFVIQNSGLVALGTPAYYLGYDIPNSIAIEFDTQRTWSYENSNHISIQTRGTEQNSPGHEYSFGSSDSIPFISDGYTHTAKIVYTCGELSIFIDNLQEPAMTIAIDLENTLSLTDGTAFVGFTASTWHITEIHNILRWSFAQNELSTLDNGLVAYFPFNGNADDESGNNHHGDIYGAELTSDKHDNINSAYSFDGYYDYIDISSVSGRIPINHTRCAWIKTEMDGIGQILDTGNYENDRGCYLGVKENKLMVGGSIGNYRWNNVLIDVDVTDGNWHFVCAVYENRSSADVYMDGEFLAQASIEYNVGDWITYIGKNHKRDIQYFYGIIDQVRIYSRVLSDDEIQRLFQTGI
ncbi:MAG: DUF1565 domain-containing protein [Sedimentisphaerales bacterium]|nr:DUF1565 domain-containing protein [Sedimentisphaerales bacterium]